MTLLDVYRRQVGKRGRPLAIRRYNGTGPARTHVDTPTTGYVRNYGANELVGAIVQGDQVAIVLVDTLAAILPVLTTDRLVVGNAEFAIKNPMKREDAGVLVALEIHASG